MADAMPGMKTRLDAVIERSLEERRIPGVNVWVKQHGETVYRRAAGLADREAGLPMREDAVFRIASITKSIVSAAALRLMESGRLDLADRVEDWLPWFRPALPDGSRPAISIHQLLIHASGLSHPYFEAVGGAYDKLGIAGGLDQSGRGLEENLRLLAEAPLAFAPGTSWRYSLGLDVLGAVLEQAAGQPLPELVRDLVTEPLGMSRTGFFAEPAVELVTPYADGDPEPVRMHDGIAVPLSSSQLRALGGPTFRALADDAQSRGEPIPCCGKVHFEPSRARSLHAYPSGGAGMIGTADDLMAFFEAVRRGGAPVLARETVELMMRDHAGGVTETMGPGWGFGYGWSVLSDPKAAGSPQGKGTIQWGGAYGHSWFIDRDAGITLISLSNTAFEGTGGAFPIAIRDAVYG